MSPVSSFDCPIFISFQVCICTSITSSQKQAVIKYEFSTICSAHFQLVHQEHLSTPAQVCSSTMTPVVRDFPSMDMLELRLRLLGLNFRSLLEPLLLSVVLLLQWQTLISLLSTPAEVAIPIMLPCTCAICCVSCDEIAPISSRVNRNRNSPGRHG